MPTRSAFKKTLLSQLVSASLMATASANVFAQDAQFAFVDNEIDFAQGADTSTATVADTGSTSAITIVNTNNADNNSFPTISFSLVDHNNTSDTFVVGLYLEINSDDDADQIEMSLGSLRVTTSGGTVTDVEVIDYTGDWDYRPIKVNARKELENSSLINVSASFDAQSNMVEFSSNTVTLRIDNIEAAMASNDQLFDDIDDRFAENGQYSYTLGLQYVTSVSASDAALGHYDASDGFTKSPQPAPSFDLGSPDLSGDFTSATFIAGDFAIADELPTGGNSGDGGGGTDDDNSDGENVVDDSTLDDIDDSNTALDTAVESAIDDGGEIPEAVVTQTRDAVQQSADAIQQITDAIENGTTVEPDNILASAQRIAQTVKTATTVINNTSSESGNEVEETTRQAVENLVAAVNNLKQRGVELNTDQQNSLNNIVENMAPSISGLTQRSQTQEDVDAQSERLNQLTETLSSLNVDPSPEVSQAVTESGRAIQKRRAELEAGGPLTDEGVAGQFDGNQESRVVSISLGSPAPAPSVQSVEDMLNDINARFGAGSPVTGGLGSNTPIDNSGTPVQASLNNGAFGSNPSGGQSGLGPIQSLQNAGRAARTRLPTTNDGAGGGFAGGLGGEGLSGGINGLGDGIGGGNALVSLSGNQRELLAATDTETEYSTEYDEINGLFTVNLGTETYLATLRSVKTAPVLAATRFDFMPDGNAVFIDKGYAYILAPGASSLIGFLSATNAQSFTPNVRADGSFYLELTETERFSGTFAFENMRGLETDACVTVTFEPPTQEVNSAEYAFTMHCDDVDVSQKILPFVDATSFLNSVTAFDLDVSFNRVNGFVTVEGIGNLKPSFFVREATAAETAFHTANQDDFGLAYMGEDVNGDGKLDYKVISETGVQVLYAAP